MKRKICILLTMAALLSTFSGPITVEAAESRVHTNHNFSVAINEKKYITGTYTHLYKIGVDVFNKPVYATCTVTTYRAEYLKQCTECTLVNGSGSYNGETHGQCPL